MFCGLYFLAMALVAGPVSAFWRLPCKASLVVQRADPIVYPGMVSDHVHSIMGGNGFGFEMTYADTQQSTCSSCMVTKDFSNYWVPTLYYAAKNGSFISVGQNGGATVYYLQRSDPNDPEYSSGLLAFPEGFRMLAGNPLLRNSSNSLEQQAISYACLGVSGPETPGFPTQNCPDGLRAQVFFPSCWDGVNLDSLDHKSHMAYPSGSTTGSCPSSHPKRFISIFYEVIWNTPDFADMWYNGSQPFVWASGDSTGYGYHGDFVNGWDVPTLQNAINNCTAASGVIEDCSVFEFFSDQMTQGCKVPASIDEQVDGILDSLPGCNQVQSGPSVAKAISGCGAPTTISSPQYNYVDLTVSKDFEYIGCGLDIAGQARTLAGASLTANNMTNDYCVDYCISQNFTIAGTEYNTQCFCGNSILAGREPIASLMGDCQMPCSGDSKEMCGGGGQISLYQKCGGTCKNVVFPVNNRTSSSGSNSSSGAGYSNSSMDLTVTSFTSTPSTAAAASPQTPSQANNESIVTTTETVTVFPLASVSVTPTSTQTITMTVVVATVTAAVPYTPGAYPGMTAPVHNGTHSHRSHTRLSATGVAPSGYAPYNYPNGTSSYCHAGTRRRGRSHTHGATGGAALRYR